MLSIDAVAGEMLTNNVTADYNSLFAGGGRDGSDPGSDDDIDADLDNYRETASSTLTVVPVELQSFTID